ncbi:MAG: BON domain-containing protein [Brevefilum sp.]
MNRIVSKIATKVEKAIMNDKAFKEDFNISVVENNGVVTLSGKVPSKDYLKLAESIANDVEGVSGVINQINIDHSLEEKPNNTLDLDDASKAPPARSGPHARN